jgi:hypothetical protein
MSASVSLDLILLIQGSYVIWVFVAVRRTLGAVVHIAPALDSNCSTLQYGSSALTAIRHRLNQNPVRGVSDAYQLLLCSKVG